MLSCFPGTKTAPFLRRTVIGDEKWAMYLNESRCQTVCRPSDPTALTLKAELQTKKLNRLQSNVVEKWQGLINRRGVILHYNNARPLYVVITRRKLMNFGWEALPRSPYSPDLASKNYHLFVR
ncbi:transposase [Trichonephila clavipes]|nr:transposase [Trichonephila clavipes]